MTLSRSSLHLRNLLLLDAATCAVMGAALALAASGLARLTAIPTELLLYAGLVLLPIAAFMALVATKALTSSPAVWLVVLGNLGWVLASVWLLISGWIAPNALGYAFIAAQATAVAALTALEHAALRRSTSVAVPA